MTGRNHLPLRPDPGPRLKKPSEALETLLNLGQEAKMLGDRIETARQDERKHSFPGDEAAPCSTPRSKRTVRRRKAFPGTIMGLS